MTAPRSPSTALPIARPIKTKCRFPAKNALALLAVSLGLIQTVFAGPTSSENHSLSFSITDDTGQTIQSQNISSIVSFDPATGALSTPAAGTPLSGNWSWSSTDVTTGQALPQQVLTWHTDAKGSNGLWLSVVQLKATGNADPFLSYSFSAKNNTLSTQAYSFSYGESIAPPFVGNYSLYADVGGSLTHGAISPVAQLTPTFSNIQSLQFSTDGGATFTNAGVDLGSTVTRTPTGTTIFGPTSVTTTGDLGSITYWQFNVGFTLTPGKDAAALSGYAELTPQSAIPEPSTYAAIVGTIALGFAVIRRKRQQPKIRSQSDLAPSETKRVRFESCPAVPQVIRAPRPTCCESRK
jgi:hypothetical protein